MKQQSDGKYGLGILFTQAVVVTLISTCVLRKTVSI